MALAAEVLQILGDTFGDRFTTDPLQCLLYGHDQGVLPDSIRRTINDRPDAVVQPVDTAELIKLVAVAREHKVPLVPRGSGTSGYGGAVPTSGGIVVDFVRMKKIVRIDAAAQTATVEPGITWQELDEALSKQDFALRVYPTSAPASTVGGWVAQGGTGIGSFRYGSIRDNVVEVELVTPAGEVKSLSGPDLDLVAGLEGITGLITLVTLKIQPLQEDVPVLAAFGTPEALEKTIADLSAGDGSLWSVSLFNPDFVRLKQAATGEKILPEDKYLCLLVARGGDLPVLREAVAQNGGIVLDAGLAQHEWAERFYPLRLKRNGPSVIAGEVVVPLARLAEFVGEAERKFKEIAFEGTVALGGKVTLLGFMLADERKKSFPLQYSSSLAFMDLAKKFGGHYYAAGMYFTDQTEDLLGPQTLQKVLEFKRELDPQGIMNPGKILPPSLDPNSPIKLLASAVKAARLGKSVLGSVGRLLAGKGEANGAAADLPPETAREAFVCAQCGYCRSTCTVFDSNPWEGNSPRGKWYLLKEYLKGNLSFDEKLVEALFFCTTCKKCDVVCQTDIENAHHWLSLRPVLNQKRFENTGLAAVRQNVVSSGNFWGVPAEAKRWMTPDIRYVERAAIAYWPGCWASIIMKNMPQNIARILNRAGIDFVFLDNDDACCGLYHALGGYAKDFADLAAKNIKNLRERGVKTLLLSCPGCFATFSENYPKVAQELGLDWDIRPKHVTVFLYELVKEGRIKFDRQLPVKVTYHDSCHVGRWFNIYDEPREVLKAIPGLELVEMEHNRENALCCGLVAAFNSMATVAHCGRRRIEEALATGAEYIVTNCAGCGSQMNFTARTLGAPIQQKDITDIVAMALGLEEIFDPGDNIASYMEAAARLLATSCIRRY